MVSTPYPSVREDASSKLAIAGEQKPHTSPPLPQVQAPPPKEHSFFDKLGDTIQGVHTPPAAAPPPPKPAPKEEESLFSRLGDAITGKVTPPPPPPPPAKEEDLFDKIGSVLGHKPTPPPEPKKTDLFSQITDTISGKKQEPAKPQGFGDKINHALGGGAAGEAEEGEFTLRCLCYSGY